MHHRVPRPSNTVSHSWPRPLYNADNGVVYFDNAVVFGYSISGRVHLNQTREIPHIAFQVLIPLDGVTCSTNLLSSE